MVLDGAVEAEWGPQVVTAGAGDDVVDRDPGDLDEFFRLNGRVEDPCEIARLVQDFL